VFQALRSGNAKAFGVEVAEERWGHNDRSVFGELSLLYCADYALEAVLHVVVTRLDALMTYSLSW
jgi:hypothetical protein